MQMKVQVQLNFQLRFLTITTQHYIFAPGCCSSSISSSSSSSSSSCFCSLRLLECGGYFRKIRLAWYLLTAVFFATVIWAWATAYFPLYTINLSNCPAQNGLSAWPITTSLYYSQTHGMFNISQQAEWYYGSQWLVFSGEKGVCVCVCGDWVRLFLH